MPDRTPGWLIIFDEGLNDFAHRASISDEPLHSNKCSQHITHPHQMTKLKLLTTVFFTALPLQAQVATIQAGDSVELILRGVPASDAQLINGVYVVDRSGRLIGLPFLDNRKIEAVGLSEGELAEKLSAIYQDAQIYTNATFSARLDGDGQVGRTVTLGGEVEKPGQFQYRQGMTIFDAVMAAGGNNKFGSLKRVSIIRDGDTIGVCDLRNDEGKRVKLLPNDTVIVDKKSFIEP